MSHSTRPTLPTRHWISLINDPKLEIGYSIKNSRKHLSFSTNHRNSYCSTLKQPSYTQTIVYDQTKFFPLTK